MSQVCMAACFYSRSEGALGSTKVYLKKVLQCTVCRKPSPYSGLMHSPQLKKLFLQISLPYGQHPRQKDSIQHLKENALKLWL